MITDMCMDLAATMDIITRLMPLLMSGLLQKLVPMSSAHVVVEKNIKSAVGSSHGSTHHTRSRHGFRDPR